MAQNVPDSTTTSIIRTCGLTKAFDTLVAVNDLELEVRRGDVFGFLGPNGSGKTTTIRMLLGLIRPTAGNVQMFGLDIATRRAEILPRIGAIIETPVFYPYLSGIDNLRTVAAASGMRPGRVNQARIEEVLEIIDLQRQATDAYRKYSLGMKQRLGIGAALLTDPELVMLDEPTNGLDPAGVHEVRQLILRLAERGKTIFLSSHILYEIQHVCNRVAILQKGHLLKQGNVRELLREDEQLVARLDTPEATRQALTLLQDVPWIIQVREETNRENKLVLYIDAPVKRASEITAILARQNLFVAELAPNSISLEEFFLDLTGEATERQSHIGMAALASSQAIPELTETRKRGIR